MKPMNWRFILYLFGKSIRLGHMRGWTRCWVVVSSSRPVLRSVCNKFILFYA
ncbi:hypothetical protein DsansV1_C02g0014831 [Dioscorea sansibarensis]